MMNLDRTEVAARACMVDTVVRGIQLQDGTDAMDDDMRRELIEQVSAGRAIELNIIADVYRQGGRVANRKHTQFSDAAVIQWTSLSTEWHSPFSRNHSVWTQDSGGFVIQSERVDGPAMGEFAIQEQIQLVAPWAVLAALRGQMKRFSIYWRPTGSIGQTVLCSLCNDGIFNCLHYRGERVQTEHGVVVVQFVYTSIEPIERSWVLAPAIEETGIHEISQSLSIRGSMALQREIIISALGLAGSASDDDILARIQVLTIDAQSANDRERELEAARATIARLEGEKSATECESVIAELRKEGRTTKGDDFEKLIRSHYESGAKNLADAVVQALRQRPPTVPVVRTQRSKASTLPALSFEDARDSLAPIVTATEAFQRLPDHIKRANRGIDPMQVFRFNPSLMGDLGVRIKELSDGTK